MGCLGILVLGAFVGVLWTIIGPWALILLLPLLLKELSKSDESTAQAGSQSGGEPERRAGVQPLTESERRAINRARPLRPISGPVILSRSEFPAGFCLKCGKDSLWEIRTQYEHTTTQWLMCKMCDPNVPERYRSARTDETIPI